MKFIRLFIVSVTLLALASCSSWRESMRDDRVAEKFANTSKNYIRLIRWHEFEKSTLTYVDDKLREDFQKRIEAFEEVKVVDYRIKNQECRPKKGTAEVDVEWDYYLPPSVTVKTVKDPQKWRYVDEENSHEWVLTTLLPEFK
jgi:hypothetical protein